MLVVVGYLELKKFFWMEFISNPYLKTRKEFLSDHSYNLPVSHISFPLISQILTLISFLIGENSKTHMKERITLRCFK